MPKHSGIRDVVEEFVSRLSSLVQRDTMSRARDAVLSAFGGGGGAGGGRDNDVAAVVGRPGRPPGRKRRKGPIQLCPVPGCSNRAAPVFGMVCSKHKDLPKAQIRKFREQRRAQKMKAKSGPGRRGKRKGKK